MWIENKAGQGLHESRNVLVQPLACFVPDEL
jgi:hypothetical protein